MEAPKFKIHRKLKSEISYNIEDLKKIFSKFEKEKFNGELKFSFFVDKETNKKRIDFVETGEFSKELKTLDENYYNFFEKKFFELLENIDFGKIIIFYRNGLIYKIEYSKSKSGIDFNNYIRTF